MPEAPQQPPRARVFRPAWRSIPAWVLLLIVALLGLVADLASKSVAFSHTADRPVRIDRESVIELTSQGRELGLLLPPHEPRTVIPSVLEFQLVLNKGAVFGLGAGRRWIFVVFTAVAIVLGLWAFGRWTDARDRWTHACIALILAGGVGNVYDRLVFACVRDFIHPLPGVRLPFGLRWPGDASGEVWPWVSNVADLFLIIGVGGLMFALWRAPDPARPGRDAAGAAAPAQPDDESVEAR